MKTSRCSFVIAAFALSCTSSTDPFENIGVDLSVSAAVARPTAPVTLTVTMTNHGSKPFTFGKACTLGFVVTTTNRTQVGPQQLLCTLAIEPARVLAPGEVYVLSRTWAGEGATGPLPPGDYFLRGAPLGDSGPFSRQVPITLER